MSPNEVADAKDGTPTVSIVEQRGSGDQKGMPHLLYGPFLLCLKFGLYSQALCMPDNSAIAARMDAVERLTSLFKLERVVYLVITCVSLVALLISACMLLYKGQSGAAELTGLFGSSGLITYTAGRLLFMWSQALRMLAGEGLKEP